MRNEGQIYKIAVREPRKNPSEWVTYNLEYVDREHQFFWAEAPRGHKQAKDIAGLARLILDTHVGTINNSTSGLPDFRIMGDEHETPFQFSLYLPLSEQEMLELQKATSSGVNLSS